MNDVASFAHTALRSPYDSVAIRVYAACADTIFRHGLRAVLSDDGGYVWAGEATTARRLIDQAAAGAPDIVLIDAEVPGLDLPRTLQAVRSALPRVRFAVLLSSLEPDIARAAVNAGAACVLAKTATQAELTAALRAVHRGVWAHSPAVAQALSAPRSVQDLPARLTPRERDLLALMAQGLTNSDIAARLSIAMPTVKFHVGHIMSKLGAENRTAAVLAGLRHKLVALEATELSPSTAG